MRRIWKFFKMMQGGFNYRYVGELPAEYPLPGTEFYYNGEVGKIEFYCVHVYPDGERADLRPVVSYKGRNDLVYSLEMIFPDIKLNAII